MDYICGWFTELEWVIFLTDWSCNVVNACFRWIIWELKISYPLQHNVAWRRIWPLPHHLSSSPWHIQPEHQILAGLPWLNCGEKMCSKIPKISGNTESPTNLMFFHTKNVFFHTSICRVFPRHYYSAHAVDWNRSGKCWKYFVFEQVQRFAFRYCKLSSPCDYYPGYTLQLTSVIITLVTM